jgi:neuroligin
VGDPAYYAAIVAHHVNCSVELPHQALMKCLRDVSLKSLLSTPIKAPEFHNAFGPSVDGVVIGKKNNLKQNYLFNAKINSTIMKFNRHWRPQPTRSIRFRHAEWKRYEATNALSK